MGRALSDLHGEKGEGSLAGTTGVRLLKAVAEIPRRKTLEPDAVRTAEGSRLVLSLEPWPG